MENLDIGKIKEKLRQIALEREWDQFHTPKNLAISLSLESSELLEIFQWLNDEQVKSLKDNPKLLSKIQEEISDVLYYLLRLSDILNIDVEKCFWEKLALSEKKYPVALSKGNSKKYTELQH